MNKHTLLGCTLLALFTACQFQINPSNDTTSETELQLPDSLSARRIQYVLDMRQEAAQQVWPAFGEKKVEGPFIYFNGEDSEVFFPNQQVLNSLTTSETFSEDYVLSPRTDSIPYHFELMISFEEADSTKLYYNNPVQQFLSVEETGIYIPSVSSTESWSAMVLHEMFHHFQYNTPEFKEYTKKRIAQLPFDIRDLRKLCLEDKSFLEAVQKENDLLLQAIDQEPNRMALIRSYLKARKSRMEQYGKVYPLLEEVENFYDIQEGSARFMEYKGMKVMEQWSKSEHEPSIQKDSLFHSHKEFQDVKFTQPDFEYLTYAGPATYHYATGFAILRLLELLEVPFQDKILSSPEIGLHTYLEDYISRQEGS
ncbi:DNA alkylation repair protein [Aureicoccus marinus]|uniref:Uncharacterized protein n=1 Tax=Aureicoccus marinus TaxID=754435 RepID=A0A2S7T6L1_9FLAO|nr:hypothetical protein [Aureicoccus marinus]PQJ15167.1 hypothetical protein BST99_04975 [Aureicoccus marinus]